MKKILVMLPVLLMGYSSTTIAEEGQTFILAEVEQDCRNFALTENVSAEKMNYFVKWCISNVTQADNSTSDE